jgi:beta-glucosidase-like glycosyl hydrolase
MDALAGWGPFKVVDLAVAAGVDLLLYVVLTAPLEALIGHLAERIERGEVPRQRVGAAVERLFRVLPRRMLPTSVEA